MLTDHSFIIIKYIPVNPL